MSAKLMKVGSGAVLAGVGLGPWLLDGMRGWGTIAVCGLGSVAGLCWLGAKMARRRMDTIPMGAAFAALFLLVGGWIGAVKAWRLPVDLFAEEHFRELAARWPGSFVPRSPAMAMWACSAAIGVLLVVIDSEFGGRLRIAVGKCAAVVGAAMGALGAVQIFSGAAGGLWSGANDLAGSFFGTFFDQSVGVAFVCMVWPLAGGFFLAEVGKPGSPWVALWGGLVAVGWLALGAVSALSGWWVSVGLVGLLLGWAAWRLPMKSLRSMAMRGGWVGLACVIAMAGGAFAAGRVPAWRGHWWELRAKLLAEGIPTNGQGVYRPDFRLRPDGLILPEDDPRDPAFVFQQRKKVWSVCGSMWASAGLLGCGPGTWPIVFPHFCDDGLLRTDYLQIQFVGNDLLQALVEWGTAGTLAWLFLLYGGVVGAVYRLRRYRAKGGPIGEREGLIVGALAGILGLLVCALWSSPLQIAAIQFYAAVLLGILWSARERGGSEVVGSAKDVLPKSEET